MTPGSAPAPAGTPPTHVRSRVLGSPVAARWWERLAVALLALLAAAWVLKLWQANLAAPFRYAELDDTKFYLMLIRSVIRHGWFGAGSSLGAPFGQQLADFPRVETT